MKNRDYKTLVAIATALALTISSALVTAPASFAADNQTKVETVYAQIDENGNVTSTTVSDQLKNVSGAKTIKDVSSLNNIENVKGDETFSEKDGALTWKGDKKDICYQGTTDRPLPVGMKITYKLDGKEISAKDLKGKSGRLTIRYEYENTSASSAKEYIPFLMVTGTILDSEHFSNVSVSGGKLVLDGERDLALGMGLPGMKEALGVKDIKIPDSFEIEADVTDYEACESATVATNDLFNSLDTKQFDSLSDLQNAMTKLQTAADQLVDGSGELKKGLDTLLSSAGTLTDGINKLSDGGSTLADGTKQLSNGTKSLTDGASSLNTGLQSAFKSTSTVLLPGVQALDEGVAKMQSELSSGMSELTGGVGSLDDSLQTVSGGAASINSSIKDQLAPLSGQLSEDCANLAASVTSTPSVSSSAYAVADGDGGTDAAIQTLSGLLSRDDVPEDVRASIQGSIDSLNSDKASRSAAAGALDSEIQSQNAALASVSGDAQALAQKAAKEAQTLQGGLQKLSESSSQVSGGISQIASGASELNLKITNPDTGLTAQVTSALSELKSGTEALRAGIEGENGLSNGLKQLSDGALKVNKGADTLNEKMRDASAGAASLSSGIGQLKSGSSALIDGVKKLDSGAKELNNGMIQFNKDGIQKLCEAFGGDTDELLKKANDMLAASRNYKNFSGISDKMDGEVNFIFLSDK